MTDEEIQERVRQLLLSNVADGYSRLLGKHYCYIRPSPGTYPYQWWWDTFFHVFILCRLGEYELAKRNMQSLFAMQEENGFVGHMIYWHKVLPTTKSDILQSRPSLKSIRPHMSALIQPSLAAQAVLRIYEGTGDSAFLIEMLPKLKAYFNWLAANRDFEATGLISIITPFESGIDWKPSYDPVVRVPHKVPSRWHYWKVALLIDGMNFLRGYDLRRIYRAGRFIVKDALMNTLYAEDLRALARLCTQAHDSDAEVFEQRASKTARSILDTMYSAEDCAFLDTYGSSDTPIRINTFTIFAAAMLKEVPPEISVSIFKRHLFNPEEFAAPYPIPSLAINDPAFDPRESRYLWRGPTWVVANWFLYKCLLSKGFEKEAIEMRNTVKRLIEASGFREYYNPFTGEGYGAREFTWSGLVVDMV